MMLDELDYARHPNSPEGLVPAKWRAAVLGRHHDGRPRRARRARRRRRGAVAVVRRLADGRSSFVARSVPGSWSGSLCSNAPASTSPRRSTSPWAPAPSCPAAESGMGPPVHVGAGRDLGRHALVVETPVDPPGRKRRRRHPAADPPCWVTSSSSASTGCGREGLARRSSGPSTGPAGPPHLGAAASVTIPGLDMPAARTSPPCSTRWPRYDRAVLLDPRAGYPPWASTYVLSGDPHRVRVLSGDPPHVGLRFSRGRRPRCSSCRRAAACRCSGRANGCPGGGFRRSIMNHDRFTASVRCRPQAVVPKADP